MRKSCHPKINTEENDDTNKSIEDVHQPESSLLDIPFTKNNFTNFKSVRVTNHLKKSTMQETFKNNERKGNEVGYEQHHTAMPINTTLRTTLSQNFEDITAEEKQIVLKKIFLKW